MMLTILGSHLCPNTLYAIIKCKEAGIEFVFRDISASLSDLKYFLALHEHNAVYAEYQECSGKEDYLTSGKIGLPCFIFENGEMTLALSQVLGKNS